MANEPQIGKHLACLNLFREADGKLYITIADAQGAMLEYRASEPWGPNYKPVDYVNQLIVDAIPNLPLKEG